MKIDKTDEKCVRLVRLTDGRIPYYVWYQNFRDNRTRQTIQNRINRLRAGNFGQSRAVGGGVSELKIDYGPGYRVYFGQDGDEIVILLCGGDKSTQDEDIKKAKEYWQIYKQEKSYVDG